MKQLLLFIFLLIATGTYAQTTATCGAKTQAGTACSRKVEKSGDKCWQHGGQTQAQKAGSTTGQASTLPATCGAPTKTGGKCKNRVKSGGKCHLHKG